MRAERQPPKYRFERSTGVATMQSLWRCALFISDVTRMPVYIEGVTHVSPTAAGVFFDAPPVSDTRAGAMGNIIPDSPPFIFKRRNGFAKREDLAAFAEHLQQLLARRFQSNDITEMQGERIQFKQDPIS